MPRVLKHLHYPLDVILACVRWFVPYLLSVRHTEDIMAGCGVSVHQATNEVPWEFDFAPMSHQAVAALKKAFRRRKRSVGEHWQIDEANIRANKEMSICPPRCR